MSYRRVPAAFLLMLSALPGGARAESLPVCAAPVFFLAPQVVGVDLPFGTLASARLWIDGASGRFEEIPVSFESSQESSCYSLREGSVRVVPALPLVPGSSYVLEVEVTPTAANCEPTGKTHKYRFIARDEANLPAELPAPTAELLVRRCDPYPDYYFFRLARPLVPGTEGLEFRLSVNGELHYCHAEGIRGVLCRNGDSERFSLQWIAEIPHTGVRVAGPVADVELRCSQARQIPCSENLDGTAAGSVDGLDEDAANEADPNAQGEETETEAGDAKTLESSGPAPASSCQIGVGRTTRVTWSLWGLGWLGCMLRRSRARRGTTQRDERADLDEH